MSGERDYAALLAENVRLREAAQSARNYLDGLWIGGAESAAHYRDALDAALAAVPEERG